MFKTITCTDGTKVRPLSQWLKIRFETVTSKSRFWNDCNMGNICTFKYKGTKYSFDDIERLSTPLEIWDSDLIACTNVICGYILLCNFGGILVEVDNKSYKVRLYEVVEDES